jgi:hypothetical protein
LRQDFTQFAQESATLRKQFTDEIAEVRSELASNANERDTTKREIVALGRRQSEKAAARGKFA